MILTLRLDLWVLLYVPVTLLIFAALITDEQRAKHGNPTAAYVGIAMLWPFALVGILVYFLIRFALVGVRRLRRGARAGGTNLS